MQKMRYRRMADAVVDNMDWVQMRHSSGHNHSMDSVVVEEELQAKLVIGNYRNLDP